MRTAKIFLAALIVSASPAWAARDMCKLLKDKGVLNDVEYNECKAAQEKDEAATEAKAKEVVGLRLPTWFNNLSLFGDVRTRYEGFHEDTAKARNRFRLRGRIGLGVVVTDELSATFRMATGNPDDPISRNQSLEKTFTAKPVALDQAYITLKPGKTLGITPGWFTLIGGKFPVTAYRLSEVLFDEDLTPEGATETVNFWEQKEGFLRGLRLTTFQWVIDEISPNNDPWVGGGQVVMDTALSNTASWSAAVADYHFENLNSVADKFLRPTSSSFNKDLANSNRLKITKDPADSTKITKLAYASRFNIINANSELNFVNPIGVGVPGGVFGDFIYNTQADSKNLGFYVGAGIGRAGKGYYKDELKAVGDWGTSYTYAWVEQDAAPSLFTYSDIRFIAAGKEQKGSTNLAAHIVRFDYMVLPGLQLTAKVHMINALDRKSAVTQSGTPLGAAGNPTLFRTQLDAVLRF